MRTLSIFDIISENTGNNYGGTIHQVANIAADTAKTWKERGGMSYSFILEGVYFIGHDNGYLVTEIPDGYLPCARNAVQVPNTQHRIITDAILHRTTKTYSVKVPFDITA